MGPAVPSATSAGNDVGRGAELSYHAWATLCSEVDARHRTRRSWRAGRRICAVRVLGRVYEDVDDDMGRLC
jgi:hypothetical protein